MPQFRRISQKIAARNLPEDANLGGEVGRYARGMISTDGAGDWSLWSNYGATPGINITSASMLTLTSVWAAVKRYSDALAKVDFYIAAGDPRGSFTPARDHPTNRVVAVKANSDLTASRFRRTMTAHALTYGNAYAEIVWDARERIPLALHIIDPRHVSVKLDARSRIVYTNNGVDFPSSDIIHISGLGFDGVTGYNPARLFDESLALAKSREVYQSSLYRNGAVPTGFLIKDGVANATQDRKLLEEFKAIHGGALKAGEIGMLTGGLKFEPAEWSPEALAIHEGLNISVRDIARIFSIPAALLADLTNANYNSLEALYIQFLSDGLEPWLIDWQQELTSKLLGKIESNRFSIQYNTASVLRADTAARTARNVAYLTNGVTSINEVRALEGMTLLDHPAADYHFNAAKSNLMPIELYTSATAKPEATDLSTVNPADIPAGDDETPTPAPDGTILDSEGLRALRANLAHELGRLVRRESQAVRKAARRPESSLDISAWAEAFYRDHSRLVAETITPALALVKAFTRREIDPQTIADQLQKESLATLRDLTVTVPPDELPEAVERAVAGWESDRAEALAASLLPDLSNHD